MSDRHEFHERILKEKTMKTFKEEFFEYLQKTINKVTSKNIKNYSQFELNKHQGKIDTLKEILTWYDKHSK